MPPRGVGGILQRTFSGGATAAAATLKLLRTTSGKLRLVHVNHPVLLSNHVVTGAGGLVLIPSAGLHGCAVPLADADRKRV